MKWIEIESAMFLLDDITAVWVKCHSLADSRLTVRLKNGNERSIKYVGYRKAEEDMKKIKKALKEDGDAEFVEKPIRQLDL